MSPSTLFFVSVVKLVFAAMAAVYVRVNKALKIASTTVYAVVITASAAV